MDWIKTLATVAPTIATALGGPLAGVAVNVAAKALGVEPSEDALEASVTSGDPEILLKLKTAENDFVIKMEELGIERERLAAEDRASARGMAAKTTLRPQAILATVFVVGFVAVLYAVFGGGDVALSDDLLKVGMYLLGILSAGLNQIMNFFFGSSAGSKQKTELLGGTK